MPTLFIHAYHYRKMLNDLLLSGLDVADVHLSHLRKRARESGGGRFFFRGLCPLIYRISVALHEEIIQVFHLLFILFFHINADKKIK